MLRVTSCSRQVGGRVSAAAGPFSAGLYSVGTPLGRDRQKELSCAILFFGDRKTSHSCSSPRAVPGNIRAMANGNSSCFEWRFGRTGPRRQRGLRKLVTDCGEANQIVDITMIQNLVELYLHIINYIIIYMCVDL